MNLNKKIVLLSSTTFMLLFLSMNFVVTYASTSLVFSTPVNLSNDSFQAKQPNVQNLGSHVYVAWTESSHGIYFRSSPDNGTTWSPVLTSPAMKLSLKGGTAQYPLMAAYGSNV